MPGPYGFSVAEALAAGPGGSTRRGRPSRRLLTYPNHVGLYSADIGPTGEQLGNFPRAFSLFSLYRRLG